MTPRVVLLATRSAGKLRELRPMFAAAGWAARDLTEAGIAETRAEDAIEGFATFEENARAKARYFWLRSGGVPVVAEDSGLEVAALGGAPGVRSKRWSGRADLAGQALDDANNALLLRELRGALDRSARYVCVAVYWDGAREVVSRGETAGWIAEERSSGGNGFGYDPYFVSAELGRAFSDVGASEKAAVSHRGRAIAGLLKSLAERS
ncbi:MAG TPA: non-canonical purine NTP pyrophosphatase [Gemmatimonadaceae bacterium]|nr:non-canonical purine NTP pyrophosphatase [Gemmatimonadaceae bacterium]